MKRMHIHVGVEHLDQAIAFYSALFGEQPTKIKSDYAKWMLDDPRINFAISTQGGSKGVNHLGIQVEEDSELEELRARLKAADLSLFDEGETVCCYARSDKSWIEDPAGIAWEAYRTMEEAQYFSRSGNAGEFVEPAIQNGASASAAPVERSGGCCA
jgi:catechol 2,3-dioxygenase-like lactoylglutathione lyase family enzyme